MIVMNIEISWTFIGSFQHSCNVYFQIKNLCCSFKLLIDLIMNHTCCIFKIDKLAILYFNLNEVNVLAHQKRLIYKF